MSSDPTTLLIDPANPAAAAPRYEVPFGVTEMRLTPRQWLAALAIVAIILIATPKLWKKAEHFDTSADYRIPYALSKDYWLYERRLDDRLDPSSIVLLGDSVIWGEYVAPDGTLSHFLNQESAQPARFINGGVNGLFPLAMEGLVEHYAHALHNRKVIVHCNVLWMTSPKADLSINREESFNHSRLVPQFRPRIPSYRADASERLSVAIEEHVPFSSWVGHLQNVYYDQRSIPLWTLEEGDPPTYPNTWKSPLAPITLTLPGEPPNDPQRGPTSPRHVPWTAAGGDRVSFDWVPLDSSLQWQAFQRVITLLRQRGNDVMVILGPFNEHMLAADQLPQYRALQQGIATWLDQNKIAHVIPQTLPSELYADDCHPLTQGYARLSEEIAAHESFRRWLRDNGTMK
jgi:hypothetical protein